MEVVLLEKVSDVDVRFHEKFDILELVFLVGCVCPFCHKKVCVKVVGNDFRVLEWCQHFEGVLACERVVYGVFVKF